MKVTAIDVIQETEVGISCWGFFVLLTVPMSAEDHKKTPGNLLLQYTQ